METASQDHGVRRWWRIVVLVALLALALVGFHPQRGSATAPAVEPASAASPVVIATIGVGDSPAGVAVSPDGSHVYTANFNGRSVSVVDAASKRLTATIPVGHFPYGVAVSPDGARVYATNSGDGSVSVIDARTNTVTNTVTVGAAPNGIAVSPDGLHVYTANFDGRSVSVIDAHTLTVTDTIADGADPGTGPYAVAVSRDGSHLYTGNPFDGSVYVIDLASKKVTDIIGVGGYPFALAVSPDGSNIYTANNYGGMSVIDAELKVVTDNINVGGDPMGIAVSPDGSQIYTASPFAGLLSVIDATTVKVTDNLTLGGYTYGVAVSPTGSRLYATNNGSSSLSIIDVSGAPINTAAPVLSGTATVGNTLTATPGTWVGSPAPTLTYQWQACSRANCIGGTVDNVGGNRRTYQLTGADAGKFIRVKVVGANGVRPPGTGYSQVSRAVTVAGPMRFSSSSFGAVKLGTTARLTVTVTNSGTTAAIPTAITTMGQGVKVTGGTCAKGTAIPAKRTCTVALNWTPTQPGNLNHASLKVSYPNGARGFDRTFLTGSATPAPCTLQVHALPATQRLPRAGTVELVSGAAASPGCRLAIRTSASPAVRGDLRYARFNVDHKTGAISVTTLGVPGVRVQVRITAVPTQAHGTPASWARTWYSG